MKPVFAITEELRERLEELDNIASELKFNKNLTGVQTEKYQIQLYKDVMSLVQDSFMKRAERSLKDASNNLEERDVHNLEAFNEIYVQAFRDYCAENKYDMQTNKPLPFTKLFFIYWRTHKKYKNVSEYGGFLELNTEEYAYRNGRAKQYLQYYAEINGITDYVLPKRVNTYKNFIKELKKVNVIGEDAMQLADDLFVTQHIIGDEIVVENASGASAGNESLTESESTKCRENSAMENEAVFSAGVENAFQKFILLCRSVLKDPDVSEVNKKYIRAYLTLNIVNNGLEEDADLKEFVDAELAKRIRTRRADSPDYVVAAEVMKRKPDTVRKKLNDAKIYLFERSSNM